MQAALHADALPLLEAAAHSLSGAFSAFAHAAAPVAIAALWQTAAVALGLALCLRLMPRLSAAHRFGVWAGGFAVVVALQALPLFAPSTATEGIAGAVSSAAARPWLERPLFIVDARWTLAIAGLWLVLAAWRAIDLAAHTVRLRRLWKNASPIEAAWAAQLQGHGSVSICTTTELDRPSVIGFFAPRILIPDWLYARLTPEELDQVILHECEHLRRRDDWTNLLQKLALVLFPLNPALAWMEHRLCREREMACDEGVVRVTRAPRAYAACLASMAERRLEQNGARRAAALSLGAFERRSELAGRVHSILGRKNLLGPAGARAVLGVVGCGLFAGAVELARSPQMVGFVSAPALQAQTAPLPQAPLPNSIDASVSPERLIALDGQNASAFHATNAMAVLPPAPRQAAQNGAARPAAVSGALAGRAASRANVASLALQRQAIRPEASDPEASDVDAKISAVREDSAPQQWIVLTAWQQTEKPAAASAAVADYDAGEDGDASVLPAAKPASRQIAITQLILRVYPPSAVATPGQKASSAAQGNSAARPSANSVPILSRQAVLPLGDGWLVIQL